MNIGRVSFAVEIDDKVCFIVIKDEVKELALHLLAGLSDDGKLAVRRAPPDYKFQVIE